MQRGFDNLLVQWEGDVEMIVYVNRHAPPTSSGPRSRTPSTAQSPAGRVVQLLRRRRARWPRPSGCSPATRRRCELLTRRTSRRSTRSCRPTPPTSTPCEHLRDSLRELPNVQTIVLADDTLDVIAKLKGFVGLYTVILSITLLFAADPADLEHDPHGHVRPTAGDRGDEARRRHRLVHPHPVHARGPDPGPHRRRRSRARGCGSINNRWTAGRQGLPAQQRVRGPRGHRQLHVQP